MPKKMIPIEIDGLVFESKSEAARAYGVSHATFIGRVRKTNKKSYTAKELGLENIRPNLSKVDPSRMLSSLTWDFVYRQITSSPMGRGVDSGAYRQAA